MNHCPPQPHDKAMRLWKRLRRSARWVRFQLFVLTTLGLLEGNSATARHWQRWARDTLENMASAVANLTTLQALMRGVRVSDEANGSDSDHSRIKGVYSSVPRPGKKSIEPDLYSSVFNRLELNSSNAPKAIQRPCSNKNTQRAEPLKCEVTRPTRDANQLLTRINAFNAMLANPDAHIARLARRLAARGLKLRRQLLRPVNHFLRFSPPVITEPPILPVQLIDTS